MQIIPLSEGSFTVDKTKQFVPFDEATDELQKRPVGSLLVEIQPFVVKTSKDILLLDTGLGFKKGNQLQLHQNLIDNNINPSEITKVLLSHLHKDHSGGISEESGDHSRHLSFPNAKYYLQERELKFAYERKSSSYIVAELDALKHSEQAVLLKDESGTIDDYISYQVTSAHSPHHQVYWIREQGEIVFFGGDDAPQLQQMKHRFVAKYDFSGKKAMELRTQWWQQGQNENWKFLFYHDVKNAIWPST